MAARRSSASRSPSACSRASTSGRAEPSGDPGRRLTLGGHAPYTSSPCLGGPRRLFPVHPAAASRRTPPATPRGSMYAVIETGGKQNRVGIGTPLEGELLHARGGGPVAFDPNPRIAQRASAP